MTNRPEKSSGLCSPRSAAGAVEALAINRPSIWISPLQNRSYGRTCEDESKVWLLSNLFLLPTDQYEGLKQTRRLILGPSSKSKVGGIHLQSSQTFADNDLVTSKLFKQMDFQQIGTANLNITLS